MRYSAAFLLAATSLISISGCSICAPGFIDDYGATGGKWQRADPAVGRVGSVFSDPGYMTSAGYPVNAGSGYSDEVYYGDDLGMKEVYPESYGTQPPADQDPQYDYDVFNDSLQGSSGAGEIIESGSIILGEQW